MNEKEIAKKILDELDYCIDGYYLSGNGREEITTKIEKIIKENKK